MSSIYLVSMNGKLSCDNGAFRYTDADGSSRSIFPHLTDRISSIGTINITASAMNLLMKNRIPITFLTRSGIPKGELSFGDGKNVFLRQKQYELLNDDRRIEIARSIVIGKVRNQRRFLQRCDSSSLAIRELERIIGLIESSSDLNEIRGYEGIGAHVYFCNLACHIPSWTGFSSRNSRPPRDPFNSVLSFLYTLLSYRVEGFAESEGFDTGVGVLHELSYGRKSLVCDLMEEFRVPLGDTIACSLFRKNQLGPDDFRKGDEDSENDDKQYSILLEKKAISSVVSAFENKLQEEVLYPPLGYSIPYWKIIQQQIHHYRLIVEGEDKEYIPMYFR